MGVLEGMKYSPVGNHSAVQVCRWCRNSLNGRGVCWKEKFYGIESHRCCEFSCAVMWCENKCLHCWRPIEMNLGSCLNEKEVDDPKEILEKIIEARKKLLMGFKGNKNVDPKKFAESLEPTLFTMSLSGEPTIYPKLSGLIKEIRKRKAVSFLVTNGQNPDAIAKLDKENALPTQLTVSMNAPNEKLFTAWHRSTNKDAWEKFNRTLDLMKKLKGKVRRALRMTLVKKGETKNKNKEFNDISNMEDENVEEYAKLIKKAQPDFIHVKGFMSVGYARDRMGYDKMPWHKEVKEFAEKLVNTKMLSEDGYKVLDEEERSCVVVLGKNKKDMKINWKKI